MKTSKINQFNSIGRDVDLRKRSRALKCLIQSRLIGGEAILVLTRVLNRNIFYLMKKLLLQLITIRADSDLRKLLGGIE